MWPWCSTRVRVLAAAPLLLKADAEEEEEEEGAADPVSGGEATVVTMDSSRCAAIDQTAQDPGASLAEADAACYAAKAAGRNLIVG